MCGVNCIQYNEFIAFVSLHIAVLYLVYKFRKYCCHTVAVLYYQIPLGGVLISTRIRLRFTQVQIQEKS